MLADQEARTGRQHRRRGHPHPGGGTRRAGLVEHRLAEGVAVHAKAIEDDRGGTVVGQQRQQEVLRPDVRAALLQRRPEAALEGLLGVGGEREVAGWTGGRPTDPAPHGLSGGVEVDAGAGEGTRRRVVALAKQREEQMLLADGAVAEASGLLLGEHDDVPGGVGEPLEHHGQATTPALGVRASDPMVCSRRGTTDDGCGRGSSARWRRRRGVP